MKDTDPYLGHCSRPGEIPSAAYIPYHHLSRSTDSGPKQSLAFDTVHVQICLCSPLNNKALSDNSLTGQYCIYLYCTWAWGLLVFYACLCSFSGLVLTWNIKYSYYFILFISLGVCTFSYVYTLYICTYIYILLFMCYSYHYTVCLQKSN